MSAIRDLADMIDTFNQDVLEFHTTVADMLGRLQAKQEEIVTFGTKRLGLGARAVRADLSKIMVRDPFRGEQEAEEPAPSAADTTSFTAAQLIEAVMDEERHENGHSIEEAAPDSTDNDLTIPTSLMRHPEPAVTLDQHEADPNDEDPNDEDPNDEDVF